MSIYNLHGIVWVGELIIPLLTNPEFSVVQLYHSLLKRIKILYLKESKYGITSNQENIHTCTQVSYMSSLEKFKRGRSPSLHLAKEGDFTRNHSATLILSINIQILVKIWKWWDIPSLLWLKTLHIWCIRFYHCTWWILCWISNAFSLQNSIQFTLLRRKW